MLGRIRGFGGIAASSFSFEEPPSELLGPSAVESILLNEVARIPFEKHQSLSILTL
jgi:hypothetical protein